MAYEPVYNQPMPLVASSGNLSAPASNTAAVVTLPPAGANTANVLCHIHFSYTATPTTATVLLSVTDNGVTVWSNYISAGGYIGNFEFPFPLVGQANAPMVITLGAAGSGISGALNVFHKTLYLPPGPPPNGLNYFGGLANNPPLWPPLVYA